MAELPPNHPAGLTPAFQEQNSLAERGFDASRATRKRGQRLAKSLAHPFVLPPRSQPSKAMRKSENGRGYPSERVSTGRRVPRGGRACLAFFSAGARLVPGGGVAAGSHHPALPLGEVTQSCSGSVSQPLPFSQLGRRGLLNAPLKKIIKKKQQKKPHGAIYTAAHLTSRWR